MNNLWKFPAAILAALLLSLPLEAQEPPQPPAAPTAQNATMIKAVDALPLGGSGTCSAACNGTVILGPNDTTGYGGITVQITSIGGGATLNFQGSNDPVCSTATNWVSQPGAVEQAQGNGNGAFAGGTISTSSATALNFNATFKCFRVNFSAYTSGTITAEGYLRISNPHSFVQGSISVLTTTLPVYPGFGNAAAAAVPVTSTATGTTAATVATLPGVAGKTTYICGFTITSDATALATGTAVVSGTISGSLSYLQTVTAIASGTSTLTQTYTPCVPASAVNTAIVVTSAAAGVGGNTIVNAQGFQL